MSAPKLRRVNLIERQRDQCESEGLLTRAPTSGRVVAHPFIAAVATLRALP
jgi:hypothetical protein